MKCVTLLQITIQIEDINDETPYFVGDYSKPLDVPENTNEKTSLVVMSAKDNDTSREYNIHLPLTISCLVK
jgi:hypothetical protein